MQENVVHILRGLTSDAIEISLRRKLIAETLTVFNIYFLIAHVITGDLKL